MRAPWTNADTTNIAVLWLVWTVTALLVLFLGIFLFRIYDAEKLERMSLLWAPTQAHVVGADVKTHHTKRRTSYEISVEYKYRFADKEYKGSRIAFSGNPRFGTQYEARIALPKIGELLTVHVDPRAPSISVIHNSRWEQKDVLFRKVGPPVFWTVIVVLAGTGGMLAAAPRWVLTKIVPNGRKASSTAYTSIES